ncbi:MAG: trigger factor [Bacteroidales bacterium]|nr:trigger factor [Bacteroidales bacterium]
MNVSQQNIDKVNTVVTVEITKADYQEQVDKALRTYRQKANIPGFRKGMVPMGMIKKMFGKQVQAEEINKLVGEKLFSFIRENNLNVLGEPLPSVEQPEIDFDTQEDFTFKFDVALAPEINLNLSKGDKVDYYTITVDEDMVSKQVEALQNRFGTHEEAEEVVANDMLRGDIAELDADGNFKEGGIQVSEVALLPTYFKNEDQKSKFIGAKKLTSVDFNLAEATENSDAEMASILKLKKEDVEGNTSNFRFTITNISHFVPAEKNEEFFKNVFGEEVKTEEEFVAKVKESLSVQLEPESDYKFGLDARKVIEEKVGELEMPEALLKRWLVATGENRTEESVNEELPKMLPELKWHLIKEQIAKDLNVKVEEADINAIAKKAVVAQLAQYGMSNLPEDMVENYAKEMLKNKETSRNLIDRATEEKIIAAIKDVVTLDVKAISSEDFYKMFENK